MPGKRLSPTAALIGCQPRRPGETPQGIGQQERPSQTGIRFPADRTLKYGGRRGQRSNVFKSIFEKFNSLFIFKLLVSCATPVRTFKRIKCRKNTERFRNSCAYLARVLADPVFVKAGANDGITGDPCSDILLANPAWKGILIEPVPHCFERLQKTFHDASRFLCVQAAVGAPTGKAKFYYVDPQAVKALPNLPSWHDQLGSFDRNHIVKHLRSEERRVGKEC